MMVKKTSKTSSNSGNELLENPEALREGIGRTESFLKSNAKLVGIIGGVVALAIIGYFVYQYTMASKSQEAAEKMYRAEYYFGVDSLDQALNGDGFYLGFIDIIEDYGSTKEGNLARFYAGSILLQQGEYQNAISYLEEFSASDLLLQARAYALIGDANMELNKFEEAANAYEKAANYKPNESFTPIYLAKAGFAYEKANNNTAAVDMYKQILDEYQGSAIYQDARKQHARLQAMASE
ncbi:tetratricopeptide repeat protein [Roseivirga sp. BDSF3-8]|uniref:tetratricopeptide repeat protein n=1 Tax=Roseivirga sp. BDSF3-8 TaxID=3241598 RepID=UPI003531D446